MAADIELLKGLLEKASLPWQIQHDEDKWGRTTIIADVDGEILDGATHYTYTTIGEIDGTDSIKDERHAALIVAAVNALPDLLSSIEALQAERDAQKERGDAFKQDYVREATARQTAEAERDALKARVEALEAEKAKLRRALPDCTVCGGPGYIEEAARTTGANQHSACRHQCDHCEGLGVEL